MKYNERMSALSKNDLKIGNIFEYYITGNTAEKEMLTQRKLIELVKKSHEIVVYQIRAVIDNCYYMSGELYSHTLGN